MTEHWKYRSAAAAARRYVELEGMLQGAGRAMDPQWLMTKSSVRRRPSGSSDDAVAERYALAQVFDEVERRHAQNHGATTASRARLIWEYNRMMGVTFRQLEEHSDCGVSRSRASDIAVAFDNAVLCVLEERGMRYLEVSPEEDRRLNGSKPIVDFTVES